MRIAVVAPACPLDHATADRVRTLAAERFAEVELVFHPQCFLRDGHFAGDDAAREDAFVAVANDPAVDAVWFARGGYGSGRIAEAALDRLQSAAGDKAYLGYSDNGMLLGGLYARGIGRPAHGPHPADVRRRGGEAAVARALGWLTGEDDGVDAAAREAGPNAAFNLTVLTHLLGTPLEPDLAGHVLFLEDVDEHHYRIDRAMFQLTSTPSMRQLAGIRAGRFAVPANDRPFGMEAEAIVRHWCARSGIAYLGAADIGHDAENRIVPFGRELEI
ncbi:MAG TPA: LD-carboxypeptidase [Sphingomonadaceae bacterium]|nr:LD-carboxypeptidase [Sphingomonadaceae bacterium]